MRFTPQLLQAIIMSNYKWFYQRLKSMSVPEVLFRFKQQVKYKSARKQKGFFPKPITDIPGKKIISLPAAAVIPENFPYSIFSVPFDFNSITDWHYDFTSNKAFPKEYAFKINMRNDKYGSAKVVWEYNRLQFLCFICCRYKKTKDDKYLEQFQNIITSWINDNPYLVGVNWYSNIEVNLRLITWFLCWEILDAAELCKTNQQFKKFVTDSWLPCIYLHCLYSYSFPSKYSSANNHLISEHAGLFVATSLWDFKESAAWNKHAKRGLEEELQKQHSENGINKEEAAEYIQFITDFFLIAYVAGKNSNNPFSEKYLQKLKQIFTYIYNFLDCKGNFPPYGDEDDGKCFILNFIEHANNFQSLLISAAIIFNDPLYKSKAKNIDTKNHILFGKEGKKIFDDLPVKFFEEESKFYPEEGHFILRKQDRNSEIYIHAEAARLGFLSIAAHGHADALSFILHVNGNPVFVDAGTYTYHTHPAWRSYFIGTLAHNTVRINNENQAKMAGSLLWQEHYTTQIISQQSNKSEDKIVASHNGYNKFGVTHARSFTFAKNVNKIIIIDTIELKDANSITIEMPFHLHPGVSIISKGNNSFQLHTIENNILNISIDKQLSPQLIKGQKEPEILGWYSPSFMQKKPCNVIYCMLTIDRTTIFETNITIQ